MFLNPPATLLRSALSRAALFTSLLAVPSPQRAGSRVVPLATPSPQLSLMPRAVPSSLSRAAAPELAVVLVGRDRGRFGGSVGVGVSATEHVVFRSLFRSLPFQPAVSLNCQRCAPIGRTRVRPRPALEGSGACP